MVVMTGPLYFIYKISHVISMCKELKKSYKEYNFVPIFWMATEDHDYEEIKQFNIFNKTISWETQQDGPVGRYKMNNWEIVIEQLSNLFSNEFNKNQDNELFKLLKILKGDNYEQIFRKLINYIFEKYGLIVLNPDDKLLKEEFLPFMIEDIKTNFSYKAINDTTEKLIKNGGVSQIIPREINLFYIENGIRERLILKDNLIEINKKGSFKIEEILKLINKNPENFSPNVSLRPLYQEVVLPNLCYIGGASEINYWLQLKTVFDKSKIIFPLLKIRNSILWIDKNSNEKVKKLNLTIYDLFRDISTLQKKFIEKNEKQNIDFNQLDFNTELLKQQILNIIKKVDSNLNSFAEAECVKIEKQLENIKKQLYKSIKEKYNKDLLKISQIKEKLFPNNNLQERYTNFFQLKPDGNFFSILDLIIQNIQPYTSDFIIIEE
jgi:bacillithiol biosynthesis cysteine-adding enzyme BshC